MPSRRAKTRDIRISAFIKAKPEKIYHALTSARELCVFWLDRAETDARNLGKFRMVWPTKDGEGCEASAVFVDLEPGRKVSWIFNPSSRRGGRVPALVNVFIEDRPRRVQATIQHAGFSAARSHDRVFEAFRSLWEDCLAKLKAHLEHGRVFKGEKLTLAAAEKAVRSRPARRR
ncbi:MAG: SRPBCC domain-containing protein [Elusimicrobia bacterium]|nr:SRPBCC domain-containing protein [Elusimicrobiota bacterium]